MRHRSALAAAAAVVSLTACGIGEDGPAPAGSAAASSHADDGHHAHAPDAAHSAGEARVVDVKADKLRFDPARLTARVGETVAVRLTSVDTEHDFRVDELGFHVHAKPGEQPVAGFVAKKPGTYRFYCSVPGHLDGGMRGELVVTE